MKRIDVLRVHRDALFANPCELKKEGRDPGRKSSPVRLGEAYWKESNDGAINSSDSTEYKAQKGSVVVNRWAALRMGR